MNRYVVTLKSSNGKSRKVVVAAEGIIDARVKAFNSRSKGETVVCASPYEASITTK